MIEKIMEEIEEATRQEDAPIYCGNMEVDGYVRISRVEAIIRKYMNDGWISVEERMPGKGDSVLMCNAEGCRIVGWWTGKTWVTGFSHTDTEKNIVAWQPLPEPYRSGKERE